MRWTASWLLPCLLALLIVSALLAAWDGPRRWLILLVACVVAATGLAWVRRLRPVLLVAYFLTLPLSIGKTLYVGGEGYWQTLVLGASDVFLLPYLALAIGRFTRGPDSPFRPLGASWAMWYLAVVWMSVLVAANHLGAALAALTLTKAVLVYAVLSIELARPRTLRLALGAFAAGMLLQVPIVLLQWLSGSALSVAGARAAEIGTRVALGDASAFRPAGLMRHPNELADYPLFLLPLALLLLFSARPASRRVRLLAAAVLAGGTVLLVLSLSRGAWIAGAVGLALMIVVARRQGLMRRRHVRVLVLAAVTGVLGVVAVYPAVLKRITEDDQRSTQVRLAMFEQATLIIRTHPVTGVGLGEYFSAAREIIPESFALYSPALRQGIIGNVVHNKYLLLMAEHGVPGALVILAMYGVFLRAWWKQSQWHDPGCHQVALAFTATLVTQLVFYLFEHFYFGFRTDALWVVFAILAAVYRLESRAAAAPVSMNVPGAAA